MDGRLTWRNKALSSNFSSVAWTRPQWLISSVVTNNLPHHLVQRKERSERHPLLPSLSEEISDCIHSLFQLKWGNKFINPKFVSTLILDKVRFYLLLFFNFHQSLIKLSSMF